MTTTIPVIEAIGSPETLNKKLKILHLEDVYSDAVLINRAITKAGIHFEILVADTKEKYIHALEDFLPDIILADHSLPSFNSSEALLILQKTGVKIPFILITAAMSDEFAANIVKRGADDYILKDRLNRLPIAIQNSLDKFNVEKERLDSFNELIKSEKRFHALIENSADGFLILSAEGKPMYVSSSVKRILGYSEQEIMAMDLVSIYHPDDILPLANMMELVLKNPGISMEGHTGRILHKNGGWRWIEATVTNLLHDPAIAGIVDNFRDVTERKLAEEEIINREHTFRTLIENSVEGMAILSAEGKPLYVSPSIKNVLGYTDKEGMHIDLIELAHPEDTSSLVAMMGEAMANPGVPVRGNPTRMQHKNGNWVWIEGTITNMLHDPSINGIVDNFRDVTERKLAEEKVINLNRLYAFISQINQTIVHACDEQTVFKESCRIAVETGKFKAAWIGMTDAANQKLNFIEGFGILPEDLAYFTNVYDKNGVHAKVLESGTYYMCNNIQQEYVSKQWKPLAAEQGYASCIVLPIKKSGSVVYTFNLYASEPNIFTAEEIALLEEATGDISFALDVFEKDRKRTSAEQNLLTTSNALRQALNNVNKIMDSSLDVIITFDEQGRFVTASAAAEHVWGYKPEELIGKKYINMVFLDDSKNTNKINDEIRNGNPITMFENKYIHKDGHIINMLWSSQWDDNDKLFYSIAKDVTKMKEAEEALKESESNLQAIFENTSDGFILADVNGIIKAFNKKSREFILLNIEKEIKVGDTIFNFMHSTKKGGHRNNLKKLLGGETMRYDYPYNRKNGKTHWFHFTVYPAYSRGKIVGISITSSDITERKQAEEENRFKANLLNTISQAAVATDINGLINYWNKAAEDIYGWTKEEAIGKNLVDITPSRATRQEALQIMEVQKKGHSWSGEFTLHRKSGIDFPAFVTNSPIYDQHQNLVGIISISSDISEKKKLEELLDKASRMARIGSYEADLLTNTLYWSGMTKEIHEVEQDFITAPEIAIAFYKEGYSREALIKAYFDAIEKNTPFDLELQIITAKGNERWVRVIGEAECKNGVCTRMYGSFQDIDKVKKAEFEVFKVYEEKNEILESIGDCFCAVDKNWNFTYWNKEAERLLGRKREEVLGKNIWKDIYPETADTITYINYHRAVEENIVLRYEVLNRSINRWLDVSAYPSANGLSIYFKDITEQKEAEAALTESEFRYRQIVETAQEGIWMIDEKNRTTFVNKRMCDMVGYLPGELMGETIQTFMDEGERRNSYEQIERRKKGLSENHDLKFITKSGKEIWTNLSTNPIVDNDGNYKGALAMITDISNRKEHELQIQKNTEERELLIRELTISLKDLKQFSYITSHNFRAPLSNLIGLLSLIDYNTLGKNNREIVEMFKTSTNQLNKTINDLIQILIIRNNVNVDVTNINIRDSLHEVCNLLSYEIKEHHCTVNVNLGIENLLYNQSYMDSILLNLLSNSIKYRSPNRPLQITVSSDLNAEGRLVLTIEDNGLGIDLNRHRSNIFGLYQRFHLNSDSAGLGLFMVKSQITALGGSIDVKSEVDKGTSFFITLSLQALLLKAKA